MKPWMMSAVLAVLVMSCESPDFGDQVSRFVDVNTRTLSTARADAMLRSRWFNAHEMATLATLNHAQVLRARLEALAGGSAGIDAGEDLKARYRQVLVALDSALTLEVEAERLIRGMRTLHRSCESREVFDFSELSRSGELAAVTIETQDANYQVSVSSNFFQAALDTVFPNIRARKVDEQNRVLHAAKRRYAELLIQKEELFDRSRAICAEEAAGFERSREELKLMLNELAWTAASVRGAIQSSRRAIEKQLTPERVEEWLRRDGAFARIVRREQRRALEEARGAVVLAEVLLGEKRSSVQRARSAGENLRALEDLEVALVDVLARMDFLQGIPGLSSEVLEELKRASQSYEQERVRVVDSQKLVLKRGES